ncbi:MAG TPA: hypothetical protein VHX60_06720 [Acidobacteriaceae bacterium]|nr:hypothetical protein [Acidobacteriaceae bacterium]
MAKAGWFWSATAGGILAVGLLAVVSAGAQMPGSNGDPIRLNPANPHYFQFRGKTIALVTSGEHYGGVINRGVDYKRYLATLAAEGMNETRLFAGSYVEVPGKSFGIERNDLAPAPGDFVAPWARSSTPGYAGGGNKFDLDQWNPEYFDRLHGFLAEASRLGIVVEISLFSSQYGEAQWALSPFNAENNVNHLELSDRKKVNTRENGAILRYQESYVRKAVAAVSGFDNVIFEIQNEPWSDRPVAAGIINPYLFPPGRDLFPNSVDVADAASVEWQTAVAGWITSEETSLGHRHLIAQCYANFRLPVAALIPGVSIVNFHYAYPEAAMWNDGLGAAIAYDETGFLGHDAAVYRRQAWNFMLSGGGIFDSLDYSFTPGHEDGADTAPNGPGGGSPALRRQLHILSAFLEALPLEHMRPDAESVVHAGAAVAHELSWPGHTYAFYLDGDGPVDLTLALPAGHYTGEWIDVVTGEALAHAEFDSTGSAARLHSPAFEGGIALRLDARGK